MFNIPEERMGNPLLLRILQSVHNVFDGDGDGETASLPDWHSQSSLWSKQKAVPQGWFRWCFIFTDLRGSRWGLACMFEWRAKRSRWRGLVPRLERVLRKRWTGVSKNLLLQNCYNLAISFSKYSSMCRSNLVTGIRHEHERPWSPLPSRQITIPYYCSTPSTVIGWI